MVRNPVIREATLAAARRILECNQTDKRYWLRSELVDSLTSYSPAVAGNAIGYLVQRGLVNSAIRRMSVDEMEGSLDTEEVEILTPAPGLEAWCSENGPSQ